MRFKVGDEALCVDTRDTEWRTLKAGRTYIVSGISECCGRERISSPGFGPPICGSTLCSICDKPLPGSWIVAYRFIKADPIPDDAKEESCLNSLSSGWGRYERMPLL